MANDSTDPLFNGSFHYLKLLGDIIAIANGFLVNNELDSYKNTLCAWYNEVIYRVELKQKEIGEDNINQLKALYKSISENDVSRVHLEIFHRSLNTVTHKAKLRLTNADSTMSGWMKEE